MTAQTADAKQEEQDPDARDMAEILPVPGTVTIVGVQCDIMPLKSREFFALMSIMTDVFGTQLMNIGILGAEDSEEMSALLMGAFLTAIPANPDRFMQVLRDMTKPVGTQDDRDRVALELENPDIDVLFSIVDALLENEKDNLWDLLGKARTYVAKWKEMFSKTAAMRNKKTTRKKT